MEPKIQAVVNLPWVGRERMIRPAMFVFAASAGFAWVEPSYMDTWSTMPAYHERHGTITAREGGFDCAITGQGGDLDGPAHVDSVKDLFGFMEEAHQFARGFAETERSILAAGRTLAQERERLYRTLAVQSSLLGSATEA